MPLFFSPEKLWISDLEIYHHNGIFHTIFIQNLKDTDGNAYTGAGNGDTYGLATSEDGFNWQYQGTIFQPGLAQNSRWNHGSLWAKSVFEEDGKFFLFYSAVSDQTTDPHPWQQVGLAESDDLKQWIPVQDGPIISLEQTYPHYLPSTMSKFCWRDPIVYQQDGYYYCTLAAKDSNKTFERSGCIALLRSKDKVTWETLPPLYSPGVYWEVETPQIAEVDGKHFLIYGTYTNKRSMRFAYSENGLLGPFCDTPHIFTPAGCYAGRIRQVGEHTYFYHWIMNMKIGRNTRVISPPKILKREGNELFVLKHPNLNDHYPKERTADDILQHLKQQPHQRGRFVLAFSDQAQIGIRGNDPSFDQNMLIDKTAHGLSLRNFGLYPELDLIDLRTLPIPLTDSMKLELYFEGAHLEVYVNDYLAFTHVLAESLDALNWIEARDQQWIE